MDFVRKIEGMQKRQSNEDSFANIVYLLMRKLHQPYSEIMNMPVPMLLKLTELWNKEVKEMEKANKKKK